MQRVNPDEEATVLFPYRTLEQLEEAALEELPDDAMAALDAPTLDAPDAPEPMETEPSDATRWEVWAMAGVLAGLAGFALGALLGG